MSDTDDVVVVDVYDHEQNISTRGISRPTFSQSKDGMEAAYTPSWSESIVVGEPSVYPTPRLILTGLHSSITEEDLSCLFRKYGDVELCKIDRSPSTGRSLGCGSVDMRTATQAIAAAKSLNQTLFRGTTIYVGQTSRPEVCHGQHELSLLSRGVEDLNLEEDGWNTHSPNREISKKAERPIRNSHVVAVDMEHKSAVNPTVKPVTYNSKQYPIPGVRRHLDHFGGPTREKPITYADSRTYPIPPPPPPLVPVMPHVGVEEHRKAAPGSGGREAPITLKDCIGRNFTFPWERCKTWDDMVDLIVAAFRHIEGLNSQVNDGHYDLLDSDGKIILPEVWKSTVKPGMLVKMLMWPTSEVSRPVPPPLPPFWTPSKKGKKPAYSFPPPPPPPPPPPGLTGIPPPPPPPPPGFGPPPPPPPPLELIEPVTIVPPKITGYNRFNFLSDHRGSDQFIKLPPDDQKAYVTYHPATLLDLKRYLWLLKHAEPERWYMWPCRRELARIQECEEKRLPVELACGVDHAPDLTTPKFPTVRVTAALRFEVDDEETECVGLCKKAGTLRRADEGTAKEEKENHCCRHCRRDDASSVASSSVSGRVKICSECSELRQEAVVNTPLAYYSVVQGLMRQTPPLDATDGSDNLRVSKVFKVVRTGSREAAVSAAFFGAGVELQDALFTCVFREDVDLAVAGKFKPVNSLYPLTEELGDQEGEGEVRVFFAEKQGRRSRVRRILDDFSDSEA